MGKRTPVYTKLFTRTQLATQLAHELQSLKLSGYNHSLSSKQDPFREISQAHGAECVAAGRILSSSTSLISTTDYTSTSTIASRTRGLATKATDETVTGEYVSLLPHRQSFSRNASKFSIPTMIPLHIV